MMMVSLHPRLTVFLFEFQGCRINTVTLAGWLRAVGEYMPEMCAASGTQDFVADAAAAGIAFDADAFRINGSEETRPPGSGIEFCSRIE